MLLLLKLSVTLIVRTIILPLVVMAQQNAANLSNHMPYMQDLQARSTDARQRGDVYEAAKYANESQEYMKKHQINPLRNFVPAFFQFPIFMSMFFALKGMANLPVER